jgi:hypothetical protein
MKFPRNLPLAAALCSLLILAGCGGGGGSNSQLSTSSGGGGGTSIPPTGANYTTCNSQQVPNWQASVFQTNYQAAIQALISHYGSNPSIGYIRIGLGRGGEINLPQGWNDSSSGACYGGYTTGWGYTVGNNSSFTWNAYLQSMVEYEGSLRSPKELLVSITPVTGVGVAVDDFIAPIAVSNGMSFGNQGLESSDMTNVGTSQPCGGDWCNLFAQYPATSSSPIRELQTLGQSCPIGTTCANQNSTDTGPLDPLLPFAIANGANDLELYYQDWLIAFDSNYASSVGASNATTAYATAIQNAAAATGVQMQILFPPQSSDQDFSDVQTLFVGNSAVNGTVIDVDWSDMDIGDGTAGTHSNYDFTISDAAIQPWIAAGKKVNLVFQNTTYGGGNTCPANGIGSNGNVASNCAMPPWIWTVLSK